MNKMEAASRRQLREQVWNMSQGECEHPVFASPGSSTTIRPCAAPARELAHIKPRGMGHTGYRDELNNVMAACELHARSTDDLSSSEWDAVPGNDRIGLRLWVWTNRVKVGWDLPDPERQETT
jgi:hypothetical protein